MTREWPAPPPGLGDDLLWTNEVVDGHRSSSSRPSTRRRDRPRSTRKPRSTRGGRRGCAEVLIDGCRRHAPVRLGRPDQAAASRLRARPVASAVRGVHGLEGNVSACRPDRCPREEQHPRRNGNAPRRATATCGRRDQCRERTGRHVRHQPGSRWPGRRVRTELMDTRVMPPLDAASGRRRTSPVVPLNRSNLGCRRGGRVAEYAGSSSRGMAYLRSPTVIGQHEVWVRLRRAHRVRPEQPVAVEDTR